MAIDSRRVYHVVAKGTRDRGGVGRYLHTLLEAWPRESGYSLHVVDPYGPAGLAGSPIFFSSACARIGLAAAIGRVDILHVHACSRGSFLRKGLITRLAARLRVPVVLHLHAPDLETFYDALPGFGRGFVSASLRRADRVVVLGRYWADVVSQRMGLASDRIDVLQSATRGPAASVSARQATPQIVFVGQLGSRKGIGDLLHALADAHLSAVPWRARILGDGDVPFWRQEAIRLGIGDRTVFEGWVPESRVREVLNESAIFVLPSRAEGLSIALLEAMAHGLAIVTTAAGGAADTLEHEQSALLVPFGDSGALTVALGRLLGDEALRARLQAGARDRFEVAHEISDYCRSLIALYDAVLSNRTLGLADRTESGR